ncbi:O-antigen polymerase [Hydrogenivirga caldilitoris]|uniref:O-antigen polymerase n=1 Tax=Hydrogenivirga caldilitoris TaxID=246264 RepID=A0A497XML6_9AQUI|nr:Wzy polymerase domain-containing protein [Hydrogenivirga caldilitoris]RLJ70125.1 O-antigen polymerase [Hydrogenivirga caldilitoris]
MGLFLLLPLSFIYILFVHLFLPNLGGTILHPREYFIWILILVILWLALLSVLKSGRLTLPDGRIPFLLFILLSISSILFNPLLNKELFLIQSVHTFAIFFIWIALHQFGLNKSLKDRILFLIFLSAGIESVIGLFQISEFFRFLPITPVFQEGIVWGVFQQKNLFGTFVALGLLVSLYLITLPSLGRFLRGSLFVIGFSLSMNLVFANSRAAWLGFIFGAFLMLLARYRIYRVFLNRLALWALVVLTGAVLGIVLYGGSKDYEKALLQRESSNAQRVLMLKTSWEMFKEKPLFGHGFGNFESLYMYYQAKVIEKEKEYSKYVGGFVSHPHNEIAFIAVQSGVMGLLGFSLVFISFFRKILSLGIQKGGLYASLLMPFLVHALVEYPMELSVVHYFTFIVLLSFISSHGCTVKELKIGSKTRVSAVAVATVLLLIGIFWFSKTFVDYMRMTLFTVEAEKGKFRPELIEGARKNTYLKNWANAIYWIEKVKVALKEKGTHAVESFILWAEKEKIRRPLKEVFYLEALALSFLGERNKNLTLMDESMKVVEEGLRLYPNYIELKEVKSTIVAKAVKVMVDYYRGKRNE